ncbi:TetR/AcrR family transcriptional regulator [Streptacidiphilus neutrinimicus]|uniref:TetR/AcrR family transcriptional regulator n=1 Tax=Streptacidiphilus neutrinimicus TaxID=105420 RepID=UPI00069364A8|nr:TetR/AcrR family transcriptional regulator [Streptacidiphilus neutrinimicus]
MQERAARTRQALVCAAAREFDRNGYAASSLARITRSAGISVGALTFHFASKEDLAAEVRVHGHAATVATVRTVPRQSEAVLWVISLTLALATLLEEDVAVRAAARLTREQPEGGPDWSSAWVPAIRERLGQPRQDEALPGTARAALAALATHLLTGVEAEIRQLVSLDQTPDGRPTARLARIWDLIRQGLAAAQAEAGPTLRDAL